MKTNRKLQLLAAVTVAILAINPAARAQTPAPLSDEMLLHALATGQIPTSQLGAGGGDDEKRAASASPGTPSIIVGGIGIDFAATESYGGGLYLQGGTAPNYGGAAYYGGGIYNTTAGSPPVNSWYNDVYNNTAGVAAGDLNGDGFADNDCDGILSATSQPANGIVADDTVDWFRLVGRSASNGVYVYPGVYLQGQPSVGYGGAIYHSTGSSLYGEDFPGDALVGEDLPADALVGEDFPGDALTDAQLDALILETLARVMDWDISPTPLTSGRTAGICDQDDNCPVAPMPR